MNNDLPSFEDLEPINLLDIDVDYIEEKVIEDVEDSDRVVLMRINKINELIDNEQLIHTMLINKRKQEKHTLKVSLQAIAVVVLLILLCYALISTRDIMLIIFAATAEVLLEISLLIFTFIMIKALIYSRIVKNPYNKSQYCSYVKVLKRCDANLEEYEKKLDLLNEKYEYLTKCSNIDTIRSIK